MLLVAHEFHIAGLLWHTRSAYAINLIVDDFIGAAPCSPF